MVFTNSYDHAQTGKQTFADLYIDTIARSSSMSKVLRDQLNDREVAKSTAMSSLRCKRSLVPTMLFPLQAYLDARAHKQVKDSRVLKAILQNAIEDKTETQDLEDFQKLNIPRTNPVKLVFLICRQARRIAELHFPNDGEFHDLIMKTNFASASRANAFLWLMEFYLESDFTEEGCDENPFGAGVVYNSGLSNQWVPQLVHMTPEEEYQENIDPQTEIDFGREKQAHRAKIIAADAQYAQDHQPSKHAVSRGKLLGDDGPSAAILPRIRPSTSRPGALSRLDASSPAGPGSTALDKVMRRKPRPPTALQLTVEHNRNRRVEYILDRGLRKAQYKARKARRQEGAIIRAIHCLNAMADPFVDSDEEFKYATDEDVPYRGRGFGGLCQLKSEADDFGEVFVSHVSVFRRLGRLLSRWKAPGAVRPFRVQRAHNGDTPNMNSEYAEGSERAGRCRRS
ncbi:uncharacterized protein PG986_014461 [Apiospora aurea]|uniref:Ino eighty subunit 1 n=1 Tax=Apiospora aurea TaxID=335848 RepID=A0ABR1PT31_9PEZI